MEFLGLGLRFGSLAFRVVIGFDCLAKGDIGERLWWPGVTEVSLIKLSRKRNLNAVS